MLTGQTLNFRKEVLSPDQEPRGESFSYHVPSFLLTFMQWILSPSIDFIKHAKRVPAGENLLQMTRQFTYPKTFKQSSKVYRMLRREIKLVATRN